MTDYVGETLRVTATAKTFARVSVTPDDIAAMYCTIFNSLGETVLVEEAMTWQADEELWFTLWITTEDGTPVRLGGTALPTGSYRARILLVDFDDHESWEFVKVRIARNPVG